LAIAIADVMTGYLNSWVTSHSTAMSQTPSFGAEWGLAMQD